MRPAALTPIVLVSRNLHSTTVAARPQHNTHTGPSSSPTQTQQDGLHRRSSLYGYTSNTVVCKTGFTNTQNYFLHFTTPIRLTADDHAAVSRKPDYIQHRRMWS